MVGPPWAANPARILPEQSISKQPLESCWADAPLCLSATGEYVLLGRTNELGLSLQIGSLWHLGLD